MERERESKRTRRIQVPGGRRLMPNGVRPRMYVGGRNVVRVLNDGSGDAVMDG